MKPLDMKYHDEEWGVPCRDSQTLFEMLNLEGAQAGLNWSTILARREHYSRVFESWDAHKLAAWTQKDIDRALGDAGIIRNKLKVHAVVSNSRAYLDIPDFTTFIWSFTGGQTICNAWEEMGQVPAQTEQSQAMSKALLKSGFKFVGPTICYAFMQACGMVNDHLVTCHRYKAVQSEVS